MQSEAHDFLSTFLAHSDTVGKTIMLVLLGMSIVSWYLIVAKLVQSWLARRHAGAFLRAFWEAPSLAVVASYLADAPSGDAFANLTRQGLQAGEHHQRYAAQRLSEAGTTGDFITRALRRVINRETARRESGLTMLASVGSTAPFVGLLGTVWSIYNALAAVGVSGQGTLDKVAGPVGEALIMTAAGLSVAFAATGCFWPNSMLLPMTCSPSLPLVPR